MATKTEKAPEKETKPYRFVGSKHYHEGRPLKRGEIIQLTESQAKNFGREKFRPASELGEVAEVEVENAKDLAKQIVADAHAAAAAYMTDARAETDKKVNEILGAARMEAENILAEAKAQAKATKDA